MTATDTILSWLRQFESPNVTFIDPRGGWPIVWRRARGTHVWDADGKKYLDLTAAFAVAATGHANPRVVRAGQRQMATLLHAMGDVHPHALKAELARKLSAITFERWSAASHEPRREGRLLSPSLSSAGSGGEGARRAGEEVPGFRVPSHALSRQEASQEPHQAELRRGQTTAGTQAEARGYGCGAARGKVLFGNSGFEAVEAALKTALLATGKPGIIAFAGAYHGLGYGALNATHRDLFRAPFRSQLRAFGRFVRFPRETEELRPVELRMRQLFRREKIGAVLVEPIQGRGGINVPPPGFLPLLRRLCDEHRALLIVDEIFTGFGRTGRWFACEHTGTVPDLICLGKALTGGFPLSACVGRAEVMDAAWPASTGEAIHTSTFLGHPVGCAMALAQIAEIQRRSLVERSAERGRHLLAWLERCAQGLARARARGASRNLRASARGLGLMAGLELTHAHRGPAIAAALRAVHEMLRRGFILLPEGEHASVISFTPPLTITRADLARTVEVLAEVLGAHRER